MGTVKEAKLENFYNELEDGNWENKPSIVLNPKKRHETKKQFKTFAIIAAILFIFYIWVTDFIKYDITSAQHRLNNDTIKPEMMKLADAGKVSAVLWVSQNYPETEAHRLDPLIAQKNSDAMLIKAQLTYRTDKDLSLKYLHAAAQEGNSMAVKYLSTKNPNDIGLVKFFTEYVFK
ncbi:TPA: hypothetical protein ACGIK9_002856 [Acinetobacter baumannii]|uniref:hypothetical protein n=1 Tax=Acinetobacter baumannii TaxID=470 RepID=UPI0033905987